MPSLDPARAPGGGMADALPAHTLTSSLRTAAGAQRGRARHADARGTDRVRMLARRDGRVEGAEDMPEDAR